MTRIGHTKAMKLIRSIAELEKSHRPCVVSIGNYDGVHKGHQSVIATLLEQAARRDVKSTVITFEPLAKEFFAPQSIQRLTSIEQRAEYLFDCGVDQVLCIEFDQQFASYSPHGFVKEVLVDGLAIQHLSVGDDFRFGQDRAGDFHLLQALGEQYGFEVVAHQTFLIDGERVSSGRVRAALEIADFDTAEKLLGRTYKIGGKVQRGQQLGRTIDYPTANLLMGDYRLPLSGVFAVRAIWQGESYDGVANLGTRPTVDGNENRLEVHIFDFDHNLYGEFLDVEFVAKIRDEKRFDSIDDLKIQINKDAQTARQLLKDLTKS